MKALTKALLSLFFVAAIGLVNVQAHDIATNTTLSEEISKLMQNVVLPEGADFTAEVKFLVNEDNEIVVISVDTEDDVIEGLIKSRLNYKKVDSDVKAHRINQINVVLKQPA